MMAGIHNPPHPPHRKLRVIIAGGGIAGLTLANALQHADGVEYVLLEARSEIAPQVGASIGIAPNGNRILDQLNCYDEIEGLTEPVESVGNHDANGKDYAARSDMFKLGHVRMNYPVCFLDRQALLRILAGHVFDPNNILLNKRVESVEHTTNEVVVHCTDGSSHHGDIVAGADGVASKVRQEMWRAADTLEPGVISPEEKKTVYAEYKCLFGISAPTKGLTARNFEVTYKKDVSSMMIVGKEDRIFWFLFGRLPRVYRADEIPRFDEIDAEQFALQNLDLPITSGCSVKFGDVWENRVRRTLVPVEEANYAHWTWGRFACLGDSIHKMTPNSGSGGNAAIESAAALANVIYSLSKYGGCRPDLNEISRALESYQQSRKFRASETIKIAHDLTRIHALKGMKERIIARYILPMAGDVLADLGTDGWIGATMLDYLPPPPRSLLGTMPFNPSQGLGKHESLLRRSVIALPLLILGVWCFATMMPLLPLDQFLEILEEGRISWGQDSSIPVLKRLFHIPFLDGILQRAALVLVPSALNIDPASSYQAFTLMVDSGAIYAIMLIEGTRGANIFKPASVPFIFGLLSTHGIGVFFPVYYFLYYTLTPIATFAALDKRLTNRAFTLSVLPVLAAAYYAPLFLAYCAPDLRLRYYAVWIWHLFPIWATIGQHILSWTVMPQTRTLDRFQSPTRDLMAIRITAGTLAALSGAIWVYTLISGSVAGLLLPQSPLPASPGANDVYFSGVRNLLIWDHVSFASSSLLWVVYLFSDLRRAGLVQHKWAFLVAGLAASSIVVGVGATTTLAWLWREEILASKRHKDAVVKKSIDIE